MKSIFFGLISFPPPFFLIDQTIILAYQLNEIQKTELNSKTFKPAFKTLIEIIIEFYFKSIDSVPTLVFSSKKIRNRKEKKNQSNRRFFFSFSKQWVVDGFLIIKSVNQFFKNTYIFRNFFAFKMFVNRISFTSFVENIFETSFAHISNESSFNFFFEILFRTEFLFFFEFFFWSIFHLNRFWQ